MIYETVMAKQSTLTYSINDKLVPVFRCPLEYSDREINVYIKENGHIIYNKILEMRKALAKKDPVGIYSGEIIDFYGKKRTVIYGSDYGCNGEFITIKNDCSPEYANTRLANTFCELAKRLIISRVRVLTRTLSIDCPKIEVCSLYKAFVHIGYNCLYFSWHLLFASPEDIDYFLILTLLNYDNSKTELTRKSILRRYCKIDNNEARLNRLIEQIDFIRWI